MFKVLVLCTGNSARSILAEAIFNRDGAGRVQAFSAGSNPTGRINSDAERLLMRKNLPMQGYRSKSWDEFAQGDSPEMNLIVSVCCSTAGEIWPVWPGAPLTANWGVDDPATAPRDQIDLAFQMTYHRLSSRINSFLALPFETMTPAELTPPLARIGSS